MKSDGITITFHLVCLLTTAGLLSYCIYKFIQNESTSLVDFQTYHRTEKDIYPSFSLCFSGEGIYGKANLKNITKYKSFLRGSLWDDQLLKIDYDEVTINFLDYVEYVVIRNNLIGESLYTWKNNGGKKTNMGKETQNSAQDNFPFFTSFRDEHQKCFTLDFSTDRIPQIKGKVIVVLEVFLKNVKTIDAMLSYYMHYPNQLTISRFLDVEYLPHMGIMSGKIEAKNIWIDNTEVIRRRSTLKARCNQGVVRHDDCIMKQILQNTKCKPPHWIHLDYPICKDKDSISRANTEDFRKHSRNHFATPDFLKKFPMCEPCNELKVLTFTMQEVQRRTNESEISSLIPKIGSEDAMLDLVFKSTVYKEILHVRAFDIESLIGNMGGYFGLFLGFTLWQAPDAIKFSFSKLKNLVPQWNGS